MMATWDLDYVANRGAWLLQITDEPDQEDCCPPQPGCARPCRNCCPWTKVDRLLRSYQDPAGRPAKNALKRRCDDLHFHLSMTYQRFWTQKTTGQETSE